MNEKDGRDTSKTMDLMSVESSVDREGLERLCNAIKTNDLHQIIADKDLCANKNLLPVSHNVTMPAIALAIQTLCNEQRNFGNEDDLIPTLIQECGVKPNDPFTIYGETKPSYTMRTLTVMPEPVTAVVSPDYFEKHTPLSLLLSYYVKDPQIYASRIYRCMQQLIALGADPSIPFTYFFDKEKTQPGSLLMASLQSRLNRQYDDVDLFKFFLEHGARFDAMDQAPLAKYVYLHYNHTFDVLTLFLKYKTIGQITQTQITDPILYKGNERDAMYIWCNQQPQRPYRPQRMQDVLRLFLELGFNPNFGLDGIHTGRVQRLSDVAGWTAYATYNQTVRQEIADAFNTLEIALMHVIQVRERRMMSVEMLRTLQYKGLPVDIQESISRKAGEHENSIKRARMALEKHDSRLWSR